MAAGIFASLSAATPAVAACQLLQVGELNVTMQGNAPLIPVSINGHDAQMLLGTGAAVSLIWRSAAKDLNLEIQPSNLQVYGPGGRRTADIVWVHDLNLAGAAIHRVPFYVGQDGISAANSVGVIGEDFLYRFDLEFDLRSGKVRLFNPKGCSGDEVVYWAKSYFMTKLTHSAPNLTHKTMNPNWLQADVSLDGHNFVAKFDTGASRSTVSAQAVREAGMRPESARDTSVVFRALTIGQEAIQNPRIQLAELFAGDREVEIGSKIRQQFIDEPDLLIGADFFLAHRVYFARSQDKMYFTYAGGPIFQSSPPEHAEPSGAGSPGGD